MSRQFFPKSGNPHVAYLNGPNMLFFAIHFSLSLKLMAWPNNTFNVRRGIFRMNSKHRKNPGVHGLPDIDDACQHWAAKFSCCVPDETSTTYQTSGPDLLYLYQHTPQIVKEINETRNRKEIENMSKKTDELTAGMIVFHESPRHGSERTHKKRF